MLFVSHPPLYCFDCQLTKCRYHGGCKHRVSTSHCLSAVHLECHPYPPSHPISRSFRSSTIDVDRFFPYDDLPLHCGSLASFLRSTKRRQSQGRHKFRHLMDHSQQQTSIKSHRGHDLPFRLHFRYDLGSNFLDLPVRDFPHQDSCKGRVSCNCIQLVLELYSGIRCATVVVEYVCIFNHQLKCFY